MLKPTVNIDNYFPKEEGMIWLITYSGALTDDGTIWKVES